MRSKQTYRHQLPRPPSLVRGCHWVVHEKFSTQGSGGGLVGTEGARGREILMARGTVRQEEEARL